MDEQDKFVVYLTPVAELCGAEIGKVMKSNHAPRWHATSQMRPMFLATLEQRVCYNRVMPTSRWKSRKANEQ